MKSSASESIRNVCFNLERLSRSFRLARPGISPLERLWNGFDSDAELFIYPNLMHKLLTYFVTTLTEMGILRLLNLVQQQLRSASESIQLV